MLWSCDQVITWQMQNLISQLPRDLYLTNLTEWWVLMRGYYWSSHMSCWSCVHIRSHDKWKMLIHFLVTWRHFRAIFLKMSIFCLFYHTKVFLWYATWIKKHISITYLFYYICIYVNFLINKYYVNYNHGHNIMRIFDVLPNFSFTTSETKRIISNY